LHSAAVIDIRLVTTCNSRSSRSSRRGRRRVAAAVAGAA